MASALTGRLGANPIEFITHATGDLDPSLSDHHAGDHAAAKTPQAAGADSLSQDARPLRVFLRLPAFLHLDRARTNSSIWTEMWKDVEKRRFITVGFTGFVLLIPLAITSTAGWIRRLGGKRWQCCIARFTSRRSAA